MKRLLKIEWQKLKVSNSFKVLILLYFIFMTLVAATLGTISLGDPSNPNGFYLDLGAVGVFDFPFIWQNVLYIAGFFKIILAVIMIIYVTNEFQYKTLRQHLIDGMSRKEFLIGKLSVATVIALVSTAFVILTILILGLIHSNLSDYSLIFMRTYFVPAYFLEVLIILTFALLLGTLLKRTGLAFGLLFLYYWVVDPLLAYKVKPLSDYFPMEAMRNLIHQPLTRMVPQSEQIGIKSITTVAPQDILIVSAYILLFSYLTFLLLKKRDI